MNRLYALLAIAAMCLLPFLTLWVYIPWVQRNFPPNPVTACTEPGPVEPIPRIEDHVAAVMDHPPPSCETQLSQCVARETQHHCPDCPTWNTLRELGVIVICKEQLDKKTIRPPINFWQEQAPMPCSKITDIFVADHIRVRKYGKPTH